MAGNGVGARKGIKAGCGLKAGWSIAAGESIEVGEGIEAGEGIYAGWGTEAVNDFGIFAGLRIQLSRWSTYARVSAKIKPKNLVSGFWVEPSEVLK